MTDDANKDVATPSKAQKHMVDCANMVRTLVAGTKAMRKAEQTYLPKQAAESANAYAVRLARSVLFNATGKTVLDMTGKVFNKPVTLEKDVPAELVTFAENIDLTGRHLNVFACDVFKDAMQPGIGFIYVDMPPPVKREDGKPATMADEQEAGIRPYLTYVPLERLIGWKSTTINGVETLTQIRILESVTVDNGPYLESEIRQIRVVVPGQWATFREDKDGKWVQFDTGSIVGPTSIPLVPVYLNRTGFMCGEPPLQNLAELNVAHWQLDSDVTNIMHVANVPILFGAGFNETETLNIGASEMVRSSNNEATLTYVEHTGTAIGAAITRLQNLETQMQVMGLQLLADKPGQTATGEVRDDVKENSPLAMMARALQDALEQAFGFMAQFAGVKWDRTTASNDKGGSIRVNTDFGIQLGAATVQDLVNMVSAGVISKETFWSELQRRGVLSDSFDPTVEKDRLETEAPVLDGPPMNLDKPQPGAAV